jgi:hypothetical protein
MKEIDISFKRQNNKKKKKTINCIYGVLQIIEPYYGVLQNIANGGYLVKVTIVNMATGDKQERIDKTRYDYFSV